MTDMENHPEDIDFSDNTQSSIKLNGFVGSFNVPNSCYKINFLLTIANKNETGYQSFLKRLEPLREKVDASKIEDLGTLLQRDINDIRIARDLIPYLINETGKSNHIAFFPSILCVLMPPKYLEENGKIDYPKPKIHSPTSNGLKIDYDSAWSIFEYYKKEKRTRFAQIEIFEGKCDFLVLDGQHRANAFRAAAGMFPDKSSIYSNFYDFTPPADFNPDLPTTIVWFESSEDNIKPNLISRNLFIDVNNNSKPISKSRLILLNDKKPENIITRLFYSYLSKNYNFSLNKLSMFHFGFDYDDDLNKNKTQICPLVLFVPEILNYAFDWFLFSDPSKRYTLGTASVNIKDGMNNSFSLFDYYFSDSALDYFTTAKDDWDEDVKTMKNQVDLEEFEKFCNSQVFFPLIYDLLNEFPLINKQVLATDKIKKQYDTSTGPFAGAGYRKQAFEKAILGGEGLYYSLMRLSDSDGNLFKLAFTESDSSNPSKQGIIATYNEHRDKLFVGITSSEIERAYRRISTIIFPTGYLMAFNYFKRHGNFGQLTINEAKDEFLKRIKSKSDKHWIELLNNFWTIYFGSVETSPKSWPLVTNMILRFIQEDGEFFDIDDFRKKSPENKIVKDYFWVTIDAYRSEKLKGAPYKNLTLAEFPVLIIKNAISNSIASTEILFDTIGLTIDDKINYSENCKKDLESSLKQP